MFELRCVVCGRVAAVEDAGAAPATCPSCGAPLPPPAATPAVVVLAGETSVGAASDVMTNGTAPEVVGVEVVEAFTSEPVVPVAAASVEGAAGAAGLESASADGMPDAVMVVADTVTTLPDQSTAGETIDVVMAEAVAFEAVPVAEPVVETSPVAAEAAPPQAAQPETVQQEQPVSAPPMPPMPAPAPTLAMAQLPPTQPPGQYPPPYPQYPPPYPQYLSGAPPAFGMPPAPEKKAPGWLVPVIVAAVLVLLAAIGGGAFALTRGGSPSVAATATPAATNTPAPTATPAVPAGFKLYTDSSNLFQMVVPADWSASGTAVDQRGALFTSASQPIAFDAKYVAGATPSSSEIATLGDTFFTGVAGASGTIAHRTGPTPVLLASITWTQFAADVTSSGVTLHAVVLVGVHGNNTFVLAYAGLVSDFATLDTQFFQPVLQSFTFLQ
jgi:hypothetical protein